MKHSMLWMGLVVACAAPVPMATKERASELRRWEAPHLAGAGEDPEGAFVVERAGRTTSNIPAPNAAREARRGMACPLDAGQHVGLTFRAAADALDDERAFVVHLHDPLSGWAFAARLDGEQPVFVEPCSAVDVEQASYELRGSWAQRGFQPLGLWVHVPSGVDPKQLLTSWSWTRAE
ncbi:MAG: hypothetical protein ACI8QC_002717 [Planctomycetota bacterium]|jgi:hypothetical protein